MNTHCKVALVVKIILLISHKFLAHVHCTIKCLDTHYDLHYKQTRNYFECRNDFFSFSGNSQYLECWRIINPKSETYLINFLKKTMVPSTCTINQIFSLLSGFPKNPSHPQSYLSSWVHLQIINERNAYISTDFGLADGETSLMFISPGRGQLGGVSNIWSHHKVVIRSLQFSISQVLYPMPQTSLYLVVTFSAEDKFNN